jgi:hypothetical protein
VVTAFKIAKGGADERIATAAVRMSFATERPFFPYREPEDLRQTQSVAGASRLLRLYLIADARLAGELAHPQGFPGETKWAGPLDDAPRLLGDVVDFTLPQAPVLTVIEDRASPRPGVDDVYFSRATDQSPIYPPPVIRTVTRDIPIFIELILFVGAVMFGLFVFVRRRARGAR